jgi:SAM-dependent methyltransferase
MSEEDRRLWDERWAAGSHGEREVSPWLRSLDAILPRRGRALEVAGGRGLNAVWLTQRGLDVTLVDVSPVALAQAREAAAAAGVPLTAVARDLEEQGLPEGPFDLVTCFHYLERRLFPAWPGVLAPGGLLVLEHPTRSNLTRHERPPERFLLGDGEIAGLVESVGGLEIVRLTEGWDESGRHQARLVANRLDWCQAPAGPV